MVTAISRAALGVEAFSAGVARPHRTRDFVVLEGLISLSDIEMHFFPADVYRHILRPSTRELRLIRAVKQALNSSPPQHPIHVNKLQLLMARLVGDAFDSYLERHVDAVVGLWGKERLGQWPMLWRFGWAMRNALVHNGCIHFTSCHSPAVDWSRLRYGFGNNGRPVLFKELAGVVGEFGVEGGKGTAVPLREFHVLMHRRPCVTHHHVGSTS